MTRKRFRKIYVEITNACNLSCKFCSVSERSKIFMPTSSFEIVLQKIYQYTDYIYLHVKGEPLLHPQISDILDLCAFFNLKTVIVTNGTLLKNTEKVLVGSPAIKQINISLHCNSELPVTIPEMEYLQAIIDFINIVHKETEIIISLRFWNQNKTDEKSTISNLPLYQVLEEALNLDFKINETLKPGAGLKIADKLWLNSDYEFTWPGLFREVVGISGTCLGLRDQLAILSNGTVVPCCLDGEGVIALGNIFDNNLPEIIESERAISILNGFKNSKRVEPLCHRCGFIEKRQHG